MPGFAGNGVMYQCDRCYDRVARRELPACIEACPEEVQAIGPRDEIIAQAHALAREMNGFFYGEMENGGTNTIYVSPVPFEQLTAEVEKGQGRPNLDRFEDVMADYFLLGRKTERVAVFGAVRGTMLLLILATGALLVYRNLPGYRFPPEVAVVLNFSHLGLVVLFLMTSLMGKLLGRSWTIASR